MSAKDEQRAKSSQRRFQEAMYRGLRRTTTALERVGDLIQDERNDRRETPAQRGAARIGNVSDLRPAMELHGQAQEPADEFAPGIPLGLLLSISGFAQEATRIPESDGETSGVTSDAHVRCCNGTATPLWLGRVVPCIGGCGRYFTGTSDKAFSFGPWPDALDEYETIEHDGHDVPLLDRRAA